MQTSPRLPAQYVKHYFSFDTELYRILANGGIKAVRSLEGGRLSLLFEGERIQAVDIVWALRYGSWPKFPLVQVDGDPFNLSIDNIMPARIKHLRYRPTKSGGLLYHGLREKHFGGFQTTKDCRRNWTAHALEIYRQDLPYVLELEAQERALRRAAPPLPSTPVPKVVTARMARERSSIPKPVRPPNVPGMEWHYVVNQWQSIPVAVHVSDDWKVRMRRYQAGAVRFEYQPLHGETWGFDAAGAVVP
ncbi:MAG: hypothetical protein ACEQSK_06940 [Sphingomonadaceae bacterium]